MSLSDIIHRSFVLYSSTRAFISSSMFISNEWIQLLFESYITLNFSTTDAYTFKGTAFAKYQTLAVLCILAREAVINARTLFLNSVLITSKVIDQNLFEQETMNYIKQFQESLPNNFLRVLDLVRGLNQANGLISVYSSNWYMLPVFNVSDTGNFISYNPQYYGQCNCATTATCYQFLNNYISGYAIGCVPLESTLQSTIECHYDLTCIQLLYSYINGKVYYNDKINLFVRFRFS